MTLKAGECVFCWLLFLCFYFFQEEIHGCLGQVVLSEFHESLAEVLEFYFFFCSVSLCIWKVTGSVVVTQLLHRESLSGGIGWFIWSQDSRYVTLSAKSDL